MATHKRYQYAFSCLYYMDKFDNPEYAVARRFLDELGKRFDNRSGHRYQRVTDWRLMPGTNLENIVTETIPHSKFVLAFFTESFGECTLKNFLSQYSFKTKSGDAECIPIALRQKDIPPLYSFTMPVLFEPDWMRDERNWETLVNHLVNNLEEVFSKDEIPKQQPQSRPSPVPQHPAQAKSQYEEAVKAVYRDLPSDYLGLGMALDLPHAELTSIRENNLRNINAAVLEMLMLFKYRSELDDTSQVGKLADTLMDLGRKDLASKVRQKLTDKDHQPMESEPSTTTFAKYPVQESQPCSPADIAFTQSTFSPLLTLQTALGNKSVDAMDSVEGMTDSVSAKLSSVDSGYQLTNFRQPEDNHVHFKIADLSNTVMMASQQQKYSYAFAFISIVDQNNTLDYDLSQHICGELKKRFHEKTNNVYEAHPGVTPGGNIVKPIQDAIKNAKYVLLFFAKSTPLKDNRLLDYFSTDAFVQRSLTGECIPIACNKTYIPRLFDYIQPLIFNTNWVSDNNNWNELIRILTDNLGHVKVKETQSETKLSSPRQEPHASQDKVDAVENQPTGSLSDPDKDHQPIETELITTMQPVEESQPSSPAEAPFTQPTSSPLLDLQTALSVGNKSVDTMDSVEGRTDSVSMTLMSVDSGYQSTDLQRDQSEDTVSHDQKNLKKWTYNAVQGVFHCMTH